MAQLPPADLGTAGPHGPGPQLGSPCQLPENDASEKHQHHSGSAPSKTATGHLQGHFTFTYIIKIRRLLVSLPAAYVPDGSTESSPLAPVQASPEGPAECEAWGASSD